jgi:Zn-dependent M28 family amino/carboxypeptidase|tara:strand:+ start:181 stop:1308 length:1128 start_codon:yes stop_codon:yes gene_type:complete
LSSDELEGRSTGSKGEELAANYIKKRFKELNVEPIGENGYFQEFSFKQKSHPHDTISTSDSIQENSITGKNVIGFIDNKSINTIVVGAHYDHLGFGGEGSLYRSDSLKIHNGADDNASGVSLMLDLAAKLKDNNNNNYMFIAFSGEELGLLGSNFFVKNPTIDIKSINYMINMDMVGRLNNENTLAVYGLGTSPIFKQTIKSNNKNFKIIENESGVGPSDHTSFYLNDIPVLHFFTGQHSDYHKPSDDSELLNYEGINLISDFIYSIISDLNDNGKLPFRETKNESQETPRFKVSLGVIPDYLYDGKGMRIDGVSKGKPAEKAGFQKGDIVIKLGDEEVTDMMSYMKALSKYENGDKVDVQISRKNELSIKKVTF